MKRRKFPNTVFVTQDDDGSLYVADNPDHHAQIGQEEIAGEYQLVRTVEITTHVLVDDLKPKRRA